jgi:hypothetical protein
MSIEETGEESTEPEGRVIMDDPPVHVPQESPWEHSIPVRLLAFGFIALLGSSIAIGGYSRGALAAGMLFALVLFVEVPLTIAMMYVLAAVLGISYGELRSAVLKLAAINIFLAGFWLMGMEFGHPFLTTLVLVPLSWYLFSRLFDLEFWETMVSIIGFPLLFLAFDELIGFLFELMGNHS